MIEIGDGTYESELLTEEQMQYIKDKRVIFEIDDVQFRLFTAYKVDKDLESLRNIEQYYPGNPKGKHFEDIVMVFQYQVGGIDKMELERVSFEI